MRIVDFYIRVKNRPLPCRLRQEIVVSVGAYDSRRNEYAPFSGRGFVWQTEAIKPDLVAPGGKYYIMRTSREAILCAVAHLWQRLFVTEQQRLSCNGSVENKDPYAYGEAKAYLLRGAQEMPKEPMRFGDVSAGKVVFCRACDRCMILPEVAL